MAAPLFSYTCFVFSSNSFLSFSLTQHVHKTFSGQMQMKPFCLKEIYRERKKRVPLMMMMILLLLLLLGGYRRSFLFKNLPNFPHVIYFFFFFSLYTSSSSSVLFGALREESLFYSGRLSRYDGRLRHSKAAAHDGGRELTPLGVPQTCYTCLLKKTVIYADTILRVCCYREKEEEETRSSPSEPGSKYDCTGNAANDDGRMRHLSSGKAAGGGEPAVEWRAAAKRRCDVYDSALFFFFFFFSQSHRLLTR